MGALPIESCHGPISFDQVKMALSNRFVKVGARDMYIPYRQGVTSTNQLDRTCVAAYSFHLHIHSTPYHTGLFDVFSF